MKWCTVLINNEEVKDVALDSWNKLQTYCKMNQLKIKEFYINNEKIEADGYFALYDVLVIGILSTNPIQIIKKGIGYYFNQHNRARMHWFNPETGEELIGQVYKPIPDWMKEISIEREKSS